MKTEIRFGATSDLTYLVDLSRRTIGKCYRSFLGDAAVDAYLESGAVDEYVRDNLDHCLVLVTDGIVVGYSVIKDNLIDLMMVAHEHHRRGLGTQLLQYVEAKVFQSFAELILESFEGNSPANNFYRKNGWTLVRTYYDETLGSNKHVFRKRLE